MKKPGKRTSKKQSDGIGTRIWSEKMDEDLPRFLLLMRAVGQKYLIIAEPIEEEDKHGISYFAMPADLHEIMENINLIIQTHYIAEMSLLKPLSKRERSKLEVLSKEEIPNEPTRKGKPPVIDLKTLNQQLDLAVKGENYEKAAKLRDKIRAIVNKLSK
jgi:hypothetical protein